MSTNAFIFNVLFQLGYCEVMWFVSENHNLKLTMSIVKMVMYLNIFFILIGGGISHFVTVYFLSLYYIVIYKQRIYEALQNKKTQSN